MILTILTAFLLSLSSPDGNLVMDFGLLADGSPQYSLRYGETDIVLESALGYEFRGAGLPKTPENGMRKEYGTWDFHSGFIVSDVKHSTFDETWEPVWGEEASIRNHYNEMAVALEKDGVQMIVRFRLYDDGLGFRYEFPQQDGLRYFTVLDELTEFRMAGDHMAWWLAGDYDTQEYNYGESRLSQIRELLPSTLIESASQYVPAPTAVQTSLQMKTDEGLYVNIHEAALVDYPAMTLILDDGDFSFKADLTPDATGYRGRLCAPCTSPWRTVMVVDDARKVLASRLILNLNEPCALDDVSWIHPVKFMGVWWEMITGKTSWSYGSSRGHGADTENVRRYIDFAAEHGFDALLVEGWNVGWRDWFGKQKDEVFDFVTPFPDFDIAGLNAYAQSKGIRLMMHHETSSSVVNYERCLDDAFDLMNRYGYDAVKTGYVGDIIPYGEHHYGQFMVNHYNRVLKKAAEHRIMVNGHEAVRPTGLCRTYPNLVGNESGLGMEYRSQILPHHVTILPFTRLQGGPMDFTPGIFEMDMSKLRQSSKQQIHSTLCKQLALYVTQASPIQMAGDIPENYMKHMDAFQFIKDVALDWDRSVYLEAEPGDYVIVARKAKGSDDWFVGGVTDENAREFTIDFAFLEPGRKYLATIYRDAPDADGASNTFETGSEACLRYEILEKEVSSKSDLKIRMAPSGGFAISLKPCDSILEPWQEGCLDIHHISTGRGNSTFMILPDGTTMMVDAGDLGYASNFKHEIMPAVPHPGKSPAQWVADYVRHFSEPLGNDGRVDMMLITHYDSDHVGLYGQSGVSELDSLLHIEKIVDRGYDYPTPELALAMNRRTLPGYIKTMEARAERGRGYEKFVVGSDSQFALQHRPSAYPGFRIRNIYANGHLWAGKGLETRDIVIGEGEEYAENLKAMNENRLSCTINISYGAFDYHSGGDISGSSASSTRPWRNVEKFVGEVIGETDVVLANHHAYSDAMYEPFLRSVTPQVSIIPAWDYYHPQPATLSNMLRAGIDEAHPAVNGDVNYVFAAGLVDSNRERLAEDGGLIMPDGHVVVRVYKGGKRFRIFVLDDRSTDYDVIYRTPVLKSRN